MSLRLHIVVASTRPGRLGPAVAEWFHGIARREGGFDARLVDLAAFGLPVFDEPRHPRLGRYEHDHTKRWSESVAAADAFVFVAPEYNHGPTPALLNALNYLYAEWGDKPAAFVSYGGASGGIRAAQLLTPVLTTLRMAPIRESVAITGVAKRVTEGVFEAEAAHERSAEAMLAALRAWAEALKPLRAG